jgi:hypothetical protein
MSGAMPGFNKPYRQRAAGQWAMPLPMAEVRLRRVLAEAARRRRVAGLVLDKEPLLLRASFEVMPAYKLRTIGHRYRL